MNDVPVEVKEAKKRLLMNLQRLVHVAQDVVLPNLRVVEHQAIRNLKVLRESVELKVLQGANPKSSDPVAQNLEFA